jgi:hypothetical protein
MDQFNYSKTEHSRIEKTLHFLNNNYNGKGPILDLGPTNPLSKLMNEKGLIVSNTPIGMDLDFEYNIVKDKKYDLVTAFEILEHMVSPFPLLKSISAPKLIASIPLKLWFADAYWNTNDHFDRHYHEFEPRQFDMLLEKAGWNIQSSEKWVSRTHQIGIRPILRRFTPRYYIIFATR